MGEMHGETSRRGAFVDRAVPPTLGRHGYDGRSWPCLIWRMDGGRLAISSAVSGGGLGIVEWILNAQVPSDYRRTDPAAHVAEIAAACGLARTGAGLLTACDVRGYRRASDGGVVADATVGIGQPIWAADDAPSRDYRPGTINLVVQIPVRLSEAALVNAVATATEAKTQALWRAGVSGTGTATDAVCVLCPQDGRAEPFAGPRSVWGARLARAVYAAVSEGLGAGE
ncbi:adenosylcobinamide hydrolase [Methylocaldum szegediense]|uniref:Adenosylcobinamide hydrolase n=2 Tax=Methylocaldum szegediense TaxID=73780 RepID=A0ABM9HZQ5_9GAMM|nr:adenosylcobinamide hydrolase [Methylocaldum szegediense]